MSRNEEFPSKSDITEVSFDLAAPPEFLLCGRFFGDASWVHSRRTIDSWEAIVGIEGTTHLAEADRIYAVGPEDVLILRPGVEHRGLRSSAGGTSFYWAHFRPRHASEGPPALLRFPSWLPGLGAGRVRSAMVQLQAEVDPESHRPRLGDYRMGTFLLELHRAWASRQEPAPLGWFGQLLEWIRVHPTAHLTVQELAARSGRHPDHVARVFRDRMGLSPLEYLHRRRADEAKRRLAETDLAIKTIAWELGIPDERQFARFFRKQTGMSPTEYRRAYSRIRYNIV